MKGSLIQGIIVWREVYYTLRIIITFPSLYHTAPSGGPRRYFPWQLLNLIPLTEQQPPEQPCPRAP